MIKHSGFFTLLSVAVFSCTSGGKTEQTDADSLKTADTATKKEVLPATPADSALTAFARFISGMEYKSTYKVAASEAWKKYAAGNTENWKVLDQRVGQKISNWAKETALGKPGEPRTVFYPFAGGDLYYPSLFFPDQDTIIMIGLEPCGTLFQPDAQPADTLAGYYRSLQHSMFFPHRLGFFRTLSMKNDFNNHLLNGTIHTILFYLSGFGNDIHYISFFDLDENGEPKNVAAAWDAKKRYTGYRIGYSKNGGAVKEMIYFSQDASDGGMKAKPGLLKYLDKRGKVVTYFKAASYLMHYSTFSVVRNYVLDHSVRILQDDSGVPYKKMLDAGFDVSLYGNFTHTIPLFKAEFQPDLKEAYASGKPQALPFMIGYTAPDGECNLQSAVKKK